MLNDPKIRGFIEENRHRRVEEIALSLAKTAPETRDFILRQIEGWQKLREKVPTWAAVADLCYPPRLALEQCSGEAAAIYKAKVVAEWLSKHPKTAVSSRENALPTTEANAATMADLTGGMGVDFSWIAPLFAHATYVERHAALVVAARHNFPLLGLNHVACIETDGVAHLATMQPVDLLFLDPARRDVAGRKTVLIEDCEPNVIELLPLLRSKCRVLLLKLSTMLDLRQAIDRLGCVSEAHVFAARGECKDLLLVCESQSHPRETMLYCANETSRFGFTLSEEAQQHCPLAEQVAGFLYEPDAAVMKAGAYKTIGARYGLQKLHPNTHLYISAERHDNFPGRCFRIEEVMNWTKQDLKRISAYKQANLSVRNFPATVAELRKRLKLREGGGDYFFACTVHENQHVIVRCTK